MTQPAANAYTGRPMADPYTPHVRLEVGGRDVTCDTLEGLNTSGGRNGRLGSGDAAVLAATYRAPVFAIPETGDEVSMVISHPGEAVGNAPTAFFGYITDVVWERDGTEALISINAADPLALLAKITLPDKIDTLPNETEQRRKQLGEVYDAIRHIIGDQFWLDKGPMDATITDRRWTDWLDEYNVPNEEFLYLLGVDAAEAGQRSALDVLRHYMHSIFMDFYYDSNRRYIRPFSEIATGFPPERHHWLRREDVIQPVPCEFVVGDPAPQFIRNDADVRNVVAITYRDLINNNIEQRSVQHAKPGTDATNYSLHHVDSLMCTTSFHGIPSKEALNLLAVKFSGVTRVNPPSVQCSVIHTGAIRDALPDNKTREDAIQRILMLAAVPGAYGNDLLFIDVEGDGVATPYVVENRTVTWLRDGWLVDLRLSHYSRYTEDTIPDVTIDWNP